MLSKILNKAPCIGLAWALALFLVLPLQAQRTQLSQQVTLTYGDHTSIVSLDHGHNFFLASGTLDEVPKHARSWITQKAPPDWNFQNELPKNHGNIRYFSDELAIYEDDRGHWHMLKGQIGDLPTWIQPWIAGPTQFEVAATHKATAPNAEMPVTLFPNPSQDAVTLQFDLAQEQVIGLRLYDLQGRIVREVAPMRRPQGPQEWSLDLTGLAGGSYVLEMAWPDGQRRLPLHRLTR